MKKQLFIVAAAVVILVCMGFAITVANQRKVAAKPVTDPVVLKLQKELADTQATMKAHDAINNTNIKNAGDRIIQLQQDKTTLCKQIIGAKLKQPLCQ